MVNLLTRGKKRRFGWQYGTAKSPSAKNRCSDFYSNFMGSHGTLIWTVQNGYTLSTRVWKCSYTDTLCYIFFYGTWRLGTTLWFPSRVGCPFSPSQLRREVLQRNIQTRRWHQKFRTMTHFIRVNQPAGVLTEIELGCQMRDQCKHMYACYTLSMRDM